MRRAEDCALMVLVAAVLAATVQTRTEATTVREVMTNCADSMTPLILCLQREATLNDKLDNCEGPLTEAFTCLAEYSDIKYTYSGLLMGAHSKSVAKETVGKRGLGQCIHRCLRGQGRMNFIQCKSMCHR